MDLDILLSLSICETADPGTQQVTAFGRHEIVDLEASDYESDLELEIEDHGAYNEIKNDTQDNSDMKEHF